MSESERLVWLSETRTLFVEAFTPVDVAALIRADVKTVNLARRPRVDESWGPPIRLTLES